MPDKKLQKSNPISGAQKIDRVDPNKMITRIRREAPNNAAYVFDCDGTLIRGDIASLTAWSLLRLGLANPDLLPKEWDEYKNLPFSYSEFRSLRNRIIDSRGIDSIYEWEAFLHAGLPPATSLDVARFAINEALKQESLEFTGPVSDLAKEMAEKSWIVSGSPDVCVWAVAEWLKIPPQRVLGTRLETVDGIFAPRIAEPGLIWESLKKTILERHDVHEPYFVAGDTIGDWQMMQMSSKWCWALIWGPQRHRGVEFREHIQKHILSEVGAVLPEEPGFYLFEGARQNWVIEVREQK